MVTKSMSLVTCRQSFGCETNDKMKLTLVKLYGEAHSYTKKTGNSAFLRISYTGRLDEIVQWRSPLFAFLPVRGEERVSVWRNKAGEICGDQLQNADGLFSFFFETFGLVPNFVHLSQSHLFEITSLL